MRHLFLVLVLLVSANVNAEDRSIMEEIDRCESNGGRNGCVYDILRFLALQPSGESNWYLGDAGKSCTQTCSDYSKRYDSRTESITAQQCETLGKSFGYTAVGDMSGSCSSPVNCAISGSGSIYRCTSGTADASYSGDRRVCYCR